MKNEHKENKTIPQWKTVAEDVRRDVIPLLYCCSSNREKETEKELQNF